MKTKKQKDSSDAPIVKRIVDALAELNPSSAMGAIELARQIVYWDEVYYLLTAKSKKIEIRLKAGKEGK